MLGKYMVVEWTPDGGTMISIATKSRNFSVSQKGNSIDVSVREDILAGQKDKLADAPDRTAEMSGLDTAVDAPDWETVDIGDTGLLVWYRRGKSSGMPSRSASAVCTGNDLGSPYDNANDWKISWDLTTVITTGEVA
jgi:hypothetical protein